MISVRDADISVVIDEDALAALDPEDRELAVRALRDQARRREYTRRRNAALRQAREAYDNAQAIQEEGERQKKAG
jgi:hypothetical protein